VLLVGVCVVLAAAAVVVAAAVRGGRSAPRSYTVLAAGDIAECYNNVTHAPSQGEHPGAGAVATAALVESQLPVDAILALGDAAYESGRPAEYRDCYAKTWGRFKSITYPTPGNHDYRCGPPPAKVHACPRRASAYYEYFGARAGPPGRGYYSFDIGRWHFISLNSEIDKAHTATHSAQMAWLKADLAAHPSWCLAAMWHEAAFSNDPLHGDNGKMQKYFDVLYDAHAEFVLSAHAHGYQRWAELAPDGAAQPARGVRNWVVGLGGGNITAVRSGRPGQEATWNRNFGVLKLTLTDDAYSWQWLNVPDDAVPGVRGQFHDSGTTRCH
jgi:hypothetical protein